MSEWRYDFWRSRHSIYRLSLLDEAAAIWLVEMFEADEWYHICAADAEAVVRFIDRIGAVPLKSYVASKEHYLA
jgi:hypothetical protein